MGRAKLTSEEKKARRVETELKIKSLESQIDTLKKDNGIIFRKFYDWKEISENVYSDLEVIVSLLGGYVIEDTYTSENVVISKNTTISNDVFKKLNELEIDLGEFK